jgi:uncharacterized membrane protein YeaQ/YmgE (transglycosylase-associated protein family)
MDLLSFILLGLVAGFIGSRVVNKTGSGIVVDTAIGLLGAVVGGYLSRTVGAHGVTGFNLPSLIIAVIGAVIVLLAYRALVYRA